MTTKKNPQKRLVLNGIRQREGKDHDWYEDERGRLVILSTSGLTEHDSIIMEMQNFSEIHYSADEVFCDCMTCPRIIPATMTRCGPCRVELFMEQINNERAMISKKNERIDELMRDLAESRKAWQDYLDAVS